MSAQRRELEDDHDAAAWIDTRPQTRGECVGRPRPCPWVSCRYHLLLHVSTAGGLFLNPSGVNVGDASSIGARPQPAICEHAFLTTATSALERIPASCALDIADAGEHTLVTIGRLLGLSRERARQLYDEAEVKLRVAVEGPAGSDGLSHRPRTREL